RWQKAGIKKAVGWHSSREGLEWHKKHYEKTSKKLMHKLYPRVCTFCKNKFKSKIKSLERNVFCSNNCRSAWRRKNKPDHKKVNCKQCGKEFETLRYLPNAFCSRECVKKSKGWVS